ncbi:MAG TPA: DUF2442 domain-containing protein [Acidobacteriaceae bacterium]
MSSFLISEELVPTNVVVDDSMIRVKFNSGLEIATPVSRFPRLARATPEQRKTWRLIGKGDGIHWPDADEDISVGTLLSRPVRRTASREEAIPALIAKLLYSTKGLHDLFQEQTFNLDGSLANSIGKVVAEFVYDLQLEPSNSLPVNAHTQDGRSVQIKLTSASSFTFRWPVNSGTELPEILLALKLTDDGFEEIYNGPYPQHLFDGRTNAANGQLKLPVSKLRELNPMFLRQKGSFTTINRWFTPDLADVA